MPFSPKTNYTYLLFDQNFIFLCKYNIPVLIMRNLCLIASSINNCCGMIQGGLHFPSGKGFCRISYEQRGSIAMIKGVKSLNAATYWPK